MSHSHDDVPEYAARDVVDYTHIVGDFYFINKYRSLWWWMAAATTLLLPPLGAFVATLMVIGCLTTDPDEYEIDVRD